MPENTRVAIGPRRGWLFRVLWRFRPERYAGEAAGDVELDAFLPLREICVRFPDGQAPNEQVARACAGRFASEGDLGPTRVDRNWVNCEINPNVTTA